MTTNAEREELAKLIANHEHPNLEPAWEAREDRSPVKFFSRKLANAILAAGYRKPRTITTVEELDALPVGSVVLDRNGLSLHKMGPLGIWNASNHTWDVQRDELEADAFPATILHAPEPTR